ncbi:MAG: DUF4132 domain-containing protein [Pirellulales bacterium]
MIAPAGLQNLAGLQRDEVEALQVTLQEVHAADADLGRRLTVYLLDGREPSALEDLSQLPEVARRMRLAFVTLHCEQDDMTPCWRRFLRQLQTRNIPFLLRLARMLEAAVSALPPAVLFCQSQLDHNRWLEMLLQEATRTTAISPAMTTRDAPIAAREIVQMLAADERTPAAFITAAFRPETQWNSSVLRAMILSLPGMADEWRRFAHYVKPLLKEGAPELRLRAVETLLQAGVDWTPFVEELAWCATDGARPLRETSAPVLREIAGAGKPFLEELARSAEQPRREQAVRLLGRWYGVEAAAFLQTLLPSEPAAVVREQIESALRELRPAAKAHVAQKLELTPPARQPLSPIAPVTEALRATLETFAAAHRVYVVRHNERLAKKQPGQLVFPPHPLQPVDEAFVSRLAHALETGAGTGSVLSKELREATRWSETFAGLRDFLVHPDCRLTHVVRLLHAIGLIARHAVRHMGGIVTSAGEQIEVYRETHDPRPTLDDMADLLRSLELPEELLMDAMFEEYTPMFDWEPEACWPYLLRHLERMERTLAPIPVNSQAYRRERMQARERTLRALAKFPATPPSLAAEIWELAVGSSKADRALTQPLCAGWPDLVERLCVLLGSTQQGTRGVAAEWLGRLGRSEAIEPLLAAARRERHDATLDAMLNALERLGASVEEFLDRERLQADAVKNLKKGLPASLAWFPWDQLPSVRWEDTQSAAPVESLQWLIVQSVKLKQPDAGAPLRRFCAKMHRADREAFGEFILEAWIRRDLQPKLSLEEARQVAKRQALGRHSYRSESTRSLAAVEADLIGELLSDLGSAAAEKGMLAVVSACGGDSVVGHVQAYVEEWCSKRAPQAKALVAMLAGIESPGALRYLLALPGRLGKAAMRSEVERLIEKIAERRGWTPTELAERTLSTCGFDASGKMLLSYGERAFVATLGPNCELALQDGAGASLKRLPERETEDDRDLVQAAHKRWKEAKAELRRCIDWCERRLQEATEMGHAWPYPAWSALWQEHPIARRMALRVQWLATHPAHPPVAFRLAHNATAPPLCAEWRVQATEIVDKGP